MPKYYTKSGTLIINPEAYALTGAPMYENKYSKKNINSSTTIYKMNLENNKKYIGKTTNFEERIEQHFNGEGSKVTKKFKPVSAEVLDEVPGFFSSQIEHEYTEDYIDQYGYKNVRGGYYTNSKTLKKTKITCYKCGKNGHYANQCHN